MIYWYWVIDCTTCDWLFFNLRFWNNTLERKNSAVALATFNKSFESLIIMTSLEKSRNRAQTTVKLVKLSRNFHLDLNIWKMISRLMIAGVAMNRFQQLEIWQCIKRRHILENHCISVQFVIFAVHVHLPSKHCIVGPMLARCSSQHLLTSAPMLQPTLGRCGFAPKSSVQPTVAFCSGPTSEPASAYQWWNNVSNVGPELANCS